MTPRFDSLASEYLKEAGFWDSLKTGAKVGALGGLGMMAKDVTDRYPNPPPKKAIEQPAGYDTLGEPKGLDLDAPQHQQYFTAAITGEPQAQPAVTPAYDPGFIKYIKSVENSIESGWKNNKWYPHKSAEGGKKTIAYGHKLKEGENFSKGITDNQALQLLTKDLDTAKANAKIHIDNLHGAGTFNKLDVKRQEMLTGFQFNLGTLDTFDNFVKAVVKNDKKGMKKEYLRYYKNPKTKKMMQVKDRNIQFYKRYLSP